MLQPKNMFIPSQGYDKGFDDEPPGPGDIVSSDVGVSVGVDSEVGFSSSLQPSVVPARSVSPRIITTALLVHGHSVIFPPFHGVLFPYLC